MKTRIIQLLAVFGVMLMSACGSSDKQETPSMLKNLVGEWHLVTWNGTAPADFDTYLSFDAARTFEIYQQVETVGYQKYTGSFSLKKEMLSGIYADGTAWGSDYNVTLSDDANTLTLVSTTAAVETSIYARAAIPSTIKSSATVVKASRAGRLPL